MISSVFTIEYPYDYRVFVSVENNLGYIPILKNAHTWGKEFFKLNFNCNEVYRKARRLPDDDVLNNLTNIIVLRDPIQRWLAGTVQYLTDYVDMNLNDVHIRTLIRDGLIFDHHTLPQFYNLLGTDLDRSVFFLCDSNLENNIDLFSNMWFEKSVTKMAPLNVHHENPNKDDIYPLMKHFLDTDELLQKKLNQYYATDILLINRLKRLGKFVDNRIPKYLHTLKEKNYNRL